MNKQKQILVLDSFAVLALLQGEPGAEQVKDWLQQAKQGHVRLLMSEINLGEVFYRTWRVYGEQAAEAVLSKVQLWPVEFVRADWELVLGAARWKGRYAISYADGFCVELSVRNMAALVSGDPEFEAVKEVEVIGVFSKR
jgi:predicted nucleic acid-binding protein